MKLSDRHYWDSVHRDTANQVRTKRRPRMGRSLRPDSWGRLLACTRSYSDHILWDHIYARYLPRQRGMKAIEIGSAPGHNLVRLNAVYGYAPFGLEYSAVGAELNRQIFAAHGIDTRNVLEQDFLSDSFLCENSGRYDLVISNGFIEHFNNAWPILERHVALLRHDDFLVVSVPNLRGINLLLARAFNAESVKAHNLDIMERSHFSALFDSFGLIRLYCDYYGFFDARLFNTNPRSLRRHALRVLQNGQRGLNVLFRTIFPGRLSGPEFCSPYLLFIGKLPPAGPSQDEQQ